MLFEVAGYLKLSFIKKVSHFNVEHTGMQEIFTMLAASLKSY
jgi:hypothetical protein